MGLFVLVVVLAVLFRQNFLLPRLVFLGGWKKHGERPVSLYTALAVPELAT